MKNRLISDIRKTGTISAKLFMFPPDGPTGK
jgi:hypothetical protein